MAYEVKDGTGSLFQNDRKSSEKAPDFKGKLKFGGKMYDLSGWTKMSKNGQEFLSIQVSDEWAPGAGSGGSTPRSNYASNPPAMSAAAMDDVIPF